MKFYSPQPMKIDYGWESPQTYRKWGPYFTYGVHAESEIRISWQSKFFALYRWMEYGETDACDQKIEEKIEPSSMHCIILKNLKPDTTYFYKISRIEDQQENPLPIYTFKTGPPEGEKTPFNFCVMSDIHAQDGIATESFASMVKNVPGVPFMISCGDAVTHGGDEKCWNDFFYQLSPFTSKFALMHTTGNHDTDHPETYSHFVQTFHHPYPNRDNGAYYYFIYGNAVFIMIDSTNAGQTSATQGLPSDEQIEWLEETLEKFAHKNFWIFAFLHHPVYSTGDSGTMAVYELVYGDLFDEYHVDGVFFGHDHHFEVYWKGKDQPWGGTHYYLVGNAGGGLSTFNRDETRDPQPNYLWKGRTYIYERDGQLAGNMGGVRNDEATNNYFIYGIMELGFTSLHINGDESEIKMIGRESQVYYKDSIKRTGHGKNYHKPEYMQEF